MNPKNKNKKNSNYKYKNTIELKRLSEGAAQKKSSRKFSIKRKIPLSILLSLTLPLSVLFFGTFEMYCGNIEDFAFSLGDFFPLCIVASLIAATVIFAILLLLDGISYVIGCGVAVWLSVMAFLQRYYLNAGIDAVVGDGVGNTEVSTATLIFNTVLWIAVGVAIAAVAFLAVKKKKLGMFFVSSAAVLFVVVCMQTVGFASLSFTTDAYIPVTQRGEPPTAETESQSDAKVLTHKGITSFSSENNVVFFLVDRFDAKYYREMEATDPDFFENLDGFTYFDDYTSLYCRTYPGVMSILTGKEYDPVKSKAANFKEIYSDGGHMRALYDKGYEINVYTEQSYVYTDASVFEGYVSNISGVNEYYIDSKPALCYDMIRLSLSQYLPIAAKNAVGYMSTPEFNAHAIYKTDEDDVFIVNEESTEALYGRVSDAQFNKVETKGRFTFIHLYGCHDVNKSNIENVKNTFKLINEYLDNMKSLGIYEDATIIITGDHSAALSDSKLIGEANKRDDGTRVTAMLFKKSGDAGVPLKRSNAQISQDELWATIYESEGILDLKTGESFFDVPEGVDRVRRYYFEMYKNSKNNDLEYNQLIEYKIEGTANDGENWEIVDRTDIKK